MKTPHALAPEQVARALDVDLDRGLDEETAAARLRRSGRTGSRARADLRTRRSRCGSSPTRSCCS